MRSRENVLFYILAGFFVTNAILAEFVGGKIFSLEQTFGVNPANISLFGIEHLSFNLTAGVIFWPFVFILTDLINEYYGVKGVRFISWLSVCLILYAFGMVWVAMQVSPADFWKNKTLSDGTIFDMNQAFELIFGQGLWIIAGSLIAFLIGQMLDVYVFTTLKKWTGNKHIWLRATGSTLISQLIDSFVVLFIAFYLGANWSLSLVLAVCIVNYIYKFCIALAITPLLYLAHNWIDKYLGKDLAENMSSQAIKAEN